MSNYIEVKITDVEIPYVLKALEEVLREKCSQRDELIKEVERIQEEIQSIEASLIVISEQRFHQVEKPKEIVSTKEKYDETWGLVKKAEFVLKVGNRLLTAKQIAILISSIDDELKEDTKLASRITWSISKPASKGERFDRFEDANGKHFYGLSEWFKSKGVPKDEYLTNG